LVGNDFKCNVPIFVISERSHYYPGKTQWKRAGMTGLRITVKKDKTDFLEVVRKNILDLLSSYKKIFVAYSGGADSHVLLHLLQGIFRDKNGVKLAVIHVNHNLSPKAKKWVEHCRKVCKKLCIEYITKSIAVEIKSSDHSPEEILRKLRYEIFAEVLPKDACLVTAHHADDQAETLLLQLFRGAGPKGLAASPRKIKFARGWLVRPLLDCSRKEILLYAGRNKLEWIEDESNANTKFDRNLIRHQLLPSIKKRWPAVVATLNRVSRHCSEMSELLAMLAEKDLQYVISKSDANVINVDLLKKLSLIQQKNVLRFWLHKLCLPMPSEVKLREIVRTVINSRYDAVPVVKWFGAEVRRFRDGLYAMPPLAPLNNKKIKISCQFKLDPKKIKVCFRQGGEKIKMSGRQGTRDLKKLMQEWGVPPWMRDRIPLVYYGKKIIAVIGYYNDGSVAVPLRRSI